MRLLKFFLFIVSEVALTALSAGFIMLVLLIAQPHPEMPAEALTYTMQMVGAAVFLPVGLGALVMIIGSEKGLLLRSRIASVLAMGAGVVILGLYAPLPITSFSVGFLGSMVVVGLVGWELLARFWLEAPASRA